MVDIVLLVMLDLMNFRLRMDSLILWSNLMTSFMVVITGRLQNFHLNMFVHLHVTKGPMLIAIVT